MTFRTAPARARGQIPPPSHMPKADLAAALPVLACASHASTAGASAKYCTQTAHPVGRARGLEADPGCTLATNLHNEEATQLIGGNFDSHCTSLPAL